MRKIKTFISIGLLLSIPITNASVPVIFSGGNGSQLSIHFPHSVEFTLTKSGNRPVFNILDLGGPSFSTTFNQAAGLTYQVDGAGIEYSLATIANGYGGYDFEPESLYFLGPDLVEFTEGSKLILNAGTLTTIDPVPESFLSGSYEMVIIGDNGADPELISSEMGNVIPEPSQLVGGCLIFIYALYSLGKRRKSSNVRAKMVFSTIF